MSNKERIEQLEAWVEAIDNATTRLTTRVKALESAVTLTDMGWATAEPEPYDELPCPRTRSGAHVWFPDHSVCARCGATKDAPTPEPAPEPSPATKAERYTAEGLWIYHDGHDFEQVSSNIKARLIAAALNSTPDPKLTALVADGITAFRLTREYVGEMALPDEDGWAWFDWVQRATTYLAEEGER